MRGMNWLFKEEPSHYGFDALVKDKSTAWSGVRNPVAQRHLHAVKKGDRILYYHTGDEKQIVGIARALGDAYPDPDDATGKAAVVDVGPVKKLPRPVTLKAVKAEKIFYIPGEHDVVLDGGKDYLSRFGAGTYEGRGYQSFDYRGVHFVGLVNVLAYKAGVGGALGDEQLAWLSRDLDAQSASTPIVVFSHVPLWAVYPAWGWTTADGEQVIGRLRRFGSVTALSGHIHQVLQKVEGTITFHSARSTAFPQPAPGTAPAPGPMKDVPAEKLRGMLGLTSVSLVSNDGPLAVLDSTLA